MLLKCFLLFKLFVCFTLLKLSYFPIINTSVAILKKEWMKTLLSYVLFSFSERLVFTFIIIKTKTKLCFSFFNINFSKFWISEDKEPLKGPLWILNASPHAFVVKKLVVMIWSHFWQVLFPHGSEPPALSIFGNTSLTRWSLRLLAFCHPTIGASGKPFLCSLSGASKIWSSSNMPQTFWNAS